MGFLKVWALIVIGLVILGWIRGKHFLVFSIAGFAGLGGLITLDLSLIHISEPTRPY